MRLDFNEESRQVRKTSELIRLAKNDPRYLEEHIYLCRVGLWLLVNCQITTDEHETLIDAILDSLDGHAFLRSYLRNHGVIESWEDERTKTYSTHAHAHWDALIMTYEFEGN